MSPAGRPYEAAASLYCTCRSEKLWKKGRDDICMELYLEI